MRIKLPERNAIYFLAVFALFSLFSIRDNYYISDALNYIEHARRDINFSESNTYFYPLYWIFLKILTIWLQPESIPTALSLITSALIVLSSTKLNHSERWIFIFFCLLSPVIFNTTQVALRNGIAIGLILSGIAYSRMILFLAAALVHPGVIPIITVLIFLNFSHETKKILGAAVALGVILFSIAPYLDNILEVRGYAQGDSSRLAGIFTYIAIIFLTGVYYLSLSGSSYRFFMPIMVGIWIFVGLNYEFGGRLFLQSFPVFLYIILKFSKTANFKAIYLFFFMLFSAYSAVLWHPLTEYYDGWLGYWNS